MKNLVLLSSLRNLCLISLATSAVPMLPAINIFVDFGSSDAEVSAGWNGISDFSAGSIDDAIDSSGALTGISVTITDAFTGTNTSGATGTGGYPDFATRDSFFGNADGVFAGIVNPSASVQIAGLNAASLYDFTFYASRGGVSDNRSALYTLTGAGAAMSAQLDAGNNVTDTISIFGVSPDSTGAITLDVSEGDANTNSTGFFYLGALEINSIPEPSQSALLLGSLTLLALRRRR